MSETSGPRQPETQSDTPPDLSKADGRGPGLIGRGLNYLKRYGPLTFGRAVYGYLVQLQRERHAYADLAAVFPQKRDAEAPKDLSFDRAAAESLGGLFGRLGLDADAARALSLYREQYRSSRYFQFLLDLFTLERSLEERAGGPAAPIVKASELPPISQPAARRNILFVTSQFPSPLHGGGNRVLNFMRILSQTHDVYLASAFNPAEDGEAYRQASPSCRSILKLPVFGYGGQQARILAWLGDRRMDVVHYEWPHSLANYDASLGKIHIFTYMEAVGLRLLMDMESLRPLSASWMQKFAELVPILRRELADSAPLEARIAVTMKDAEFFHRLDPCQEYTVLNHGLTFEDFTLPEAPAEPHTLVFVGNYQHYPNMDAMNWFFEGVWPEVQRQAPEARLFVVGANPPEALKAQQDGRNVFVTGGVPDVRPYIQKASFCIAPLISGAGLRGKLIEYAALRRTFVATSIAATDLLFEEGRDFFRADNHTDFAWKIVRLLKDPELAARMGTSAFETARTNYDTPRLTEFLERIYARLVAKGAGR